MMIYAASEMIYADVDTNVIRFKWAGSFDVRLQCGGWDAMCWNYEWKTGHESEGGICGSVW